MLFLAKIRAQCSGFLPWDSLNSKQDQSYNCFIDFSKAFYSINYEFIWNVLKSYGVNEHIIRMLKALHGSTKDSCENSVEIGHWFHQEKSYWSKGDWSSPVISTSYLERVMHIISMLSPGLKIAGLKFNNFKFADDVYLIQESLARLQESLERARHK